MNLDRILVRLKNLPETPPRKYVLMFGSIEMGAMYIDSYRVVDDVFYGSVDGKTAPPEICFPASAGFLVLPTAHVRFESMETVLRKNHSDQARAEALEKELHPDAKSRHSNADDDPAGGVMAVLLNGPPPADPFIPDGDNRQPGGYL